MPVTLAQAKLDSQDDIEAGVIDEFRKESYILDNITFDDAVSPGTQGSTLTYGYSRLITQPTAAFRAINAEYTPQEVTKARYTVDLKVFGGSFQIDRVIAGMGGLVGELELQVSQKTKAARTLFHDTFINGDVATDANAFDGLNKAVAGTSTEYNLAVVTDISTDSLMTTNAHLFMDALDEWLGSLSEKPTALMGNSKLIAKIKGIARRAGYATKSEDAFGRTIDGYDGIPLINMGDKPGVSTPIVPIQTRTVNSVSTTGLTDLYAAYLSIEGVHGVTLAGEDKQNLVKQYMPDLTAPGAVKTGEVEIVAALAVKATKSAGAFRNLKVQ